MPIYEYRGSICSDRFERLTAADAGTPACPSCGARDARRLLSLIAAPAGRGPGAQAEGEGCGGGGCCGGSGACRSDN